MKKVAVEIKSAETKSIGVNFGSIADIEVNRTIRICKKFKAIIDEGTLNVTAQGIEYSFTAHAKKQETVNTIYQNLMSGFKEANHANEVENYVQYLGKKKLKKFDYELRFTALTDGGMYITVTRI